MTYADLTKQSPETQAAIEQEVRVLLKVAPPPPISLKISFNLLKVF